MSAQLAVHPALCHTLTASSVLIAYLWGPSGAAPDGLISETPAGILRPRFVPVGVAGVAKGPALRETKAEFQGKRSGP